MSVGELHGYGDQVQMGACGVRSLCEWGCCCAVVGVWFVGLEFGRWAVLVHADDLSGDVVDGGVFHTDVVDGGILGGGILGGGFVDGGVLNCGAAGGDDSYR